MFAWFIALEKKTIINKRRMNNLSLFIESAYFFLFGLSFFKDIILLGNLNCQSVQCIDRACWMQVGVLLWKSSLLGKVPTQALMGVTRPGAHIYGLP